MIKIKLHIMSFAVKATTAPIHLFHLRGKVQLKRKKNTCYLEWLFEHYPFYIKIPKKRHLKNSKTAQSNKSSMVSLPNIPTCDRAVHSVAFPSGNKYSLYTTLRLYINVILRDPHSPGARRVVPALYIRIMSFLVTASGELMTWLVLRKLN